MKRCFTFIDIYIYSPSEYKVNRHFEEQQFTFCYIKALIDAAGNKPV